LNRVSADTTFAISTQVRPEPSAKNAGGFFVAVPQEVIDHMNARAPPRRS
jgi:hypothetical protein